jgi:hypothetical protein
VSLVTTDYGLVYNTDWSVCTTIRTDDVPFPGVKSFAVEEGTENLVINGDFENGSSSWGGGIVTDEDSYFGSHSMKVTYNWVGQSYSNIAEGEVYTISAYGRKVIGANARVKVEIMDSSSNLLVSETLLFPNTYWQRQSLTFTIPANGDHLNIYTNKSSGDNNYDTNYGYIDGVQLEKKPFATSFVDGTRPDGNWLLSGNYTPDLVISFWRKLSPIVSDRTILGIKGLASDGTTEQVINNFQGSTNDFWFGTSNTRAKYYDRTPYSYSGNTWMFIVLLYSYNHGHDVLKEYVFADDWEGAFMLDVTSYLSSDSELQLSTINEISIARCYSPEPLRIHDDKISNLYIGTYDPEIWTDEYIAKVYYAKRPWLAPDKKIGL